MRLDELPRGRPGHIAGVDWSSLRPNEARRLRELGFDEGVAIEKLHNAPFGADPIACQVGRMIVAIRRVHAAAVTVDLTSGTSTAS